MGKKFTIKNFLKSVASKANKEGTSFRAPSSGGNIKKEMDWKYGHGEFADIKKRRKPGESKFNYDVRMRKGTSKIEPVTRTPEQIEGIDRKSEIKGDFSTDYSFGFPMESNTNDLRSQDNLNFGITSGMTFGEAFAQAGKGGARAGTDPFFWTNPETGEEKSFLYDFEKKGDDEVTEEATEEVTEETPPVIEEVEEEKLRFPELSKYHFKNSPSYTGQ